ncbi:MAG TPA: hypothetical protein DCM28_02685, partial [Phycisphaerales bacterium]|nr:hypothetical protein [Phycisphaerales bacterium]
AMHAIQSLTAMGLGVPDDVSVTGFDDLPVAQISTPGLTSVGYDLKSYARKIAEIVVDRVTSRFETSGDGVALPSMIRWELEPKLMIRQSTSMPKSKASRRLK